MFIKEIVVSRTVRVNTGNYEGTEHFLSMKAEMGELDKPIEVGIATAQLNAHVERALVAQLVRAYKVRGKKDMTAEKIAKHHGLSYVPK